MVPLSNSEALLLSLFDTAIEIGDDWIGTEQKRTEQKYFNEEKNNLSVIFCPQKAHLSVFFDRNYFISFWRTPNRR